jgi:tetratricopeptide (TPR) repeat protein
MKRLAFALSIIALLSTTSLVAGAQTEAEWLASLKRTEKTCGRDDSRTGEIVFAMGTFYHKQKKYDSETKMYDRAMEIFAKHPGNHSDLLRYYSDQLARVYCEEGKYEQSEKLFKQAIKLGNQLPGKDKTYAVPNTLAGLAQLYCAQGRYPEAEAALNQRIEMRHRFMNSGQVDLALVDLADLYTRWAKYDQAQQVFDQLLKISPMPVQVRQAYAAYMTKTADKPNSQAVAN